VYLKATFKAHYFHLERGILSSWRYVTLIDTHFIRFSPLHEWLLEIAPCGEGPGVRRIEPEESFAKADSWQLTADSRSKNLPKSFHPGIPHKSRFDPKNSEKFS
jgi:hypothetical protein